MKARILAGIIIAGVLATSAAQSATAPQIEEFNSGFNTTAARQDTVAHKAPCKSRIAKNDLDSAPYHWKNQPKSSQFTPATQNFDLVC